MRTIPLLPCVIALALFEPARSQQVSMALSCPAPLTASGVYPGGGTTITVPAGLLPDFDYNTESAGGVNTWLTWNVVESPTGTSLYYGHWAALGAGSATFGPNEFVVDVTATSPVDVVLRLTRDGLLPPGSVQSISVDVGDDGTVEFTESQSTLPFLELPVTLGTQPLPIRVVVSTAATLPGTTSTLLSIDVRPDNGLTIDRAVLGCTEVVDDLTCQPSFEGEGVWFQGDVQFATTGVPMVLVLGLDIAPLLLPPVYGNPCLLLPQGDATALLPLAMPVANLEIPAAARPVTVWAQAVTLDLNLLRPTDGFRIIAQ